MDNETKQPGEPGQQKEGKSVVNYRPGVEGQDCLSCANFDEPDRCQKVRGEISPTGVCDLWEVPSEIDGMQMGDMEALEEILFGPGGQ